MAERLQLLGALLVMAVAGSGCDGSPTTPGTPGSQVWLFEIELENHDPRFPPTWLGLVVETDGTVSTYDQGSRPTTSCSHYWQRLISDDCVRSLTESQLASHLAATTPLLELPQEELLVRRQQAAEVSDGPFHVPNKACNDAGVLALVSFRYDAESRLYRPLVLRLEGDQIRQNLSPGALALSPWLLELAKQVPALDSWRNGTLDCRPD